MTTHRKRHGGMYTETKRVVMDAEGNPVVKQVTCCCEAPAARPKECALVTGNKTPCRCDCHRSKP